MKKNFLFSLFFLLLLFNSNAENLINKQRLISANSWLYQALNVLFLDTGDVSIVDVAPYSYEEFYFYFPQFPPNLLDVLQRADEQRPAGAGHRRLPL